jgi:hypothetical protein
MAKGKSDDNLDVLLSNMERTESTVQPAKRQSKKTCLSRRDGGR